MKSLNSIVQELYQEKLISVPEWLPNSVRYLARVGSQSYGLQNSKDTDLVVVVFPPLKEVFPSLKGDIPGFDKEDRFSTYQKHHITYKDKWYDIAIYSIVDFVKLATENNPNILDYLFVEEEDVIYIHPSFQNIRDKRKQFLSQDGIKKYTGFAKSQWQRYKRDGGIKYAYHTIRMWCELEQLIWKGDLKLKENADFYKRIREGGYTSEELDLVEMACSEGAFGGPSGYFTNLPEKCLCGKDLLLESLVAEYGNSVLSLLGQNAPTKNVDFDDECLREWLRERYG